MVTPSRKNMLTTSPDVSQVAPTYACAPIPNSMQPFRFAQYRQTFQACRHWRWLPWIGLDAFRIEKAVTRNNAHLITTRHHFYTIGIGSTNTVRLEYNKYRQIALHCQELTSHLPQVSFSTQCRRPVLQMKRIPQTDMTDIQHPQAARVLDILKRYSHPGIPADWEAFPYLQVGLQMTKSFLNATQQAKLGQVLTIASKHGSRVGPMYGDLHHENILSLSADRFYLIDPTCFMLSGIQAYDALHYIAYWTWKSSGLDWSYWMDALTACHNSGWMAPGCEHITRNFIDIDLGSAAVFYGTARLGQLSISFGESWKIPERQQSGLSALIEQC